MKIIKLVFAALLVEAAVFAQSAGVGQIWSTVSGTLQSAAVANGNGTALAVNGLSSAILTVNCSVACTGGTTINFEGSGDNTNYVALNAVQLGTGTIATVVTNQGTTITQWQVPLGGIQSIRARISAYSAGTVTVTANASTAPYNPVTVQANQTGSWTVTSNQGGAPWTQNVTQFGGTNISTGTGASGTGIPRVTISNDSTLAANQSVNLNQIAGTGAVADPCQTATKHYTPVNITANTQIITGAASKQTYVCAVNLVVGPATNVALVEGTVSVCGTGTTGMAGGATAATGWNFGANGGLTLGDGRGAVMATATAADNVCLLVSAANQVSGTVVWVQQ